MSRRASLLAAACLIALLVLPMTATIAFAQAGRRLEDEEQPPGLLGLWLSIGLLILISFVVVQTQRRRRRRREAARWRAAAPGTPAPLGTLAQRRTVRHAHHLVRDVDEAWARGDSVRLAELAAPEVASLFAAAAAVGDRRIDEYRGIRIEAVGALEPEAGEDERVVVRLEASTRTAGDAAGAAAAGAAGTRLYRWRRLVLIGALTAALLVSLAAVASQTVDFETDRAEPRLLVVRGGERVSGPPVLRHVVGDRIAFRVRADVRDVVVVPDYEISEEVAPGAPAEVDTFAGIEGSFVVRLERSGTVVARLQVRVPDR